MRPNMRATDKLVLFIWRRQAQRRLLWKIKAAEKMLPSVSEILKAEKCFYKAFVKYSAIIL